MVSYAVRFALWLGIMLGLGVAAAMGEITRMLTFTVFGVAQSKGSLRAYVPRGMKFPIVTESNRNARSWAQLVAEGANRALGASRAATLETGPVRVTLAFYLPRPKALPKTRPVAHVTAPDVDKLARAVLDALTAVAWRDDSQVVELLAVKRYADLGDPPHVTVHVEPCDTHLAPLLDPVPLVTDLNAASE